MSSLTAVVAVVGVELVNHGRWDIENFTVTNRLQMGIAKGLTAQFTDLKP